MPSALLHTTTRPSRAAHIPAFRRSPERRQEARYTNLCDAQGNIDLSVVVRIAQDKARARIKTCEAIRDGDARHRPDPAFPIISWRDAMREELRSVWQWALSMQEVRRGWPKHRAEQAARVAGASA